MAATGSAQASDCIDCIAGKYVSTVESDEASDCIDCVAGSYVVLSGSDEASDCNAGQRRAILAGDRQ